MELGEPSGDGPIPDPSAALVAHDETGFGQHLEVVRDGGLGAADRCDEVAGAHLPGRGLGQEAQEAHAGAIGQVGESAAQLAGVGFAQRCLTDARAALIGLEHR